MKKFYYLLLMLPLLAMLAACSDDDNDLPDVDISIRYSGAVEQDGKLLVAQGKTLTIEAINATPAPGTKEAILGNTVYYIDGVPFYTIGVAPFGCEIDTSNLSVGTHRLSFYSQVFQVDREVGFALYGLRIEVTGPDSDPGDGAGTVTPGVQIQEHGN